MLALTRKKGESIIIGDDIEVVLLGINGEQVKLGVVAPKSIPVFRKEIHLQIREENLAAQNVSAGSLKDLADAVKSIKSSKATDDGKPDET